MFISRGGVPDVLFLKRKCDALGIVDTQATPKPPTLAPHYSAHNAVN